MMRFSSCAVAVARRQIIYAGVAAITAPIRRIHCLADDRRGAPIKAQFNRFQ